MSSSTPSIGKYPLDRSFPLNLVSHRGSYKEKNSRKAAEDDLKDYRGMDQGTVTTCSARHIMGSTRRYTFPAGRQQDLLGPASRRGGQGTEVWNSLFRCEGGVCFICYHEDTVVTRSRHWYLLCPKNKRFRFGWWQVSYCFCSPL